METFNHRGIIKLINSYAYKEDFYFVMDYAKGGELSKYILKYKILSENNAKRIFLIIKLNGNYFTKYLQLFKRMNITN